MITVGIYIYINDVARRLDLFDDENISVTSSIQDINDISKVFTDYSQSFTVPATDNNNSIFSHWYDNIVDNGFDARLRKDAFIELDTIPFKKGKIQLDRASMEKRMPKDYTITFFGSLISLKDAFGGRFLRDIDFSDYNITYTEENVKDIVTTANTNDLKFPLITSLNTWQYGTGGSTFDNYDVSVNPIDASDLFPALRLNKVFDAIANDLGVTFEGSFLGDARFTNAYLWLKNAEVFSARSIPTLLNFTAKSGTDQDLFDLATESFLSPVLSGIPDVVSYQIQIPFPFAGIRYFLDVHKDGVYQYTVEQVSNASLDIILLTFDNTGGEYTFFFSADSNTTVNFTFNFISIGDDPRDVSATGTLTPTLSVNVANYMPDIKIEDFFSGVLKLFNLTCFSNQSGIFKIEQLESFYNSGNIIDLTQYVISDSMEIGRVQGFKTLRFEHQKSESLTNTAYLANSERPYSDLFFETDFDGGEYSVNVPFESPLFSELLDTNLVVGYALKTDLKPYIPKPIILYDYGTLQTSSNFKFRYDATTINATTYNAFGNDTLIGGNVFTLNFDSEQSPLTGLIETNSLYQQYYADYIANLYSFKSRNIKIKAILPISLLATISLNDRVIIRDKRYLINSFTTNLTTGEVDFDLLTDFRTI